MVNHHCGIELTGMIWKDMEGYGRIWKGKKCINRFVYRLYHSLVCSPTTATMGKNKQVLCKICLKTMRSDVVKRHMKVHVKRNEAHPTTKRKHDEDNPHEEDQPMIKKNVMC